MKHLEDVYQYGAGFSRFNPRFNYRGSLEDRFKEAGLNDGLPPGFKNTWNNSELPPGFMDGGKTIPQRKNYKKDYYDLEGVLDRIHNTNKDKNITDHFTPHNVPADELVQGPKTSPTLQELTPQQQYQLNSLVNSVNSKVKPHQTTTRQGAAVDYVQFLHKHQHRTGTNKMSPADIYLGHDKVYYANDKIALIK